ncbi:MAG TPA: heavy metal translocating P-type ATPase metal-binding domain-containing protein [Flavipsychrobacter sp.]|nr:heavy metal translocating P-type ATPase metal-binding domain-containing protein [Flavipsychrobacter sp.]
MSLVEQKNTIIIERPVKQDHICYHCGASCITDSIEIEGKLFCCEGCKLVYEILDENGLCDYYKIQNHPGLTQIKPVRNDKYAYLDNEEIAQKLYKFTDGNNSIVTLYIPGVHCSSCMWLLEHMHKLSEGITESRLNFTAKEVTIHFQREKISFRKIVELLTTIGYEPYISLDDAGKKKAKNFNRQKIYKLGVAGFCFGNIMLMSFPEYLTGHGVIEHQYANLFRILNLLLSIPVFFYSASEFFTSAWAGFKQRILNIDAPIVLALVITYSRSIYEIVAGIGGGYLDSMSGIVFFMLVGRIVQERTYKSISFHRDYKAYFPIAVNVVTTNGIVSKNLQDLKEKDVVELHNDEIVPADSILVKGNARIDYSFVTGESEPVNIPEGTMVYAGGKQVGEKITIQIVKEVAGSYLTSLWNHYAFQKNKIETNNRESIIHKLSKYFTYVLFALAALTAIYWWVNDPSKILPSVSAMLIVACPCALLLAATYTNGNLLRLFSNNGLFLRDATIIEQLGKVNHIVFDKTGTLTQGSTHFITSGHQLTEEEKDMLHSVVRSSKHPYSKALATHLGARTMLNVNNWQEHTGKGVEADINGNNVLVGSAAYVNVQTDDVNKATVYVRINDKVTAFYLIPDFRESIPQVVPMLNNDYELSLLSGDNDRQKNVLKELFANDSELLFEQKPMDKLHYIEKLQTEGEKVMMVGDGLNDAGALQQSNVGVTLADDINNFTPSCDAILDAKKFSYLPGLMRLARSGKGLINLSFFISILYNIVGLSISMQAKMEPMIAAILMPASTLSIVLISTGVSSLMAKRFGLTLKG